MAKNDYYVIAYQILAYLYHCLKEDQEVDIEMLAPAGKLFRVNKRYWIYIFEHLLMQGYIEGIVIDETFEGKTIEYLGNCMITPEGIAFLTSNSLMGKVKNALKTIKDIIPFELI